MSKDWKVRRIVRERKYDENNPFTYWMKGTDKCNEEYEEEERVKRQKIRSAVGRGEEGRGGEWWERLSKGGGRQTREGYFRQLKSEINKVQYDATQERAVQRHVERLEEGGEKSGGELDFNELVHKSKRIPVKKFVEYKREIRLSKLKQVDIEANIHDMKNLIVKADEELQENIGTEKKSFEEVNIAVAESRKALEESKREKAELKKRKHDAERELNERRNEIVHTQNVVRELAEKIEQMTAHKRFLVRIIGYDDDESAKRKQQLLDDFDERMELFRVCNDFAKIEFVNLEQEEDTLVTQPSFVQQDLRRYDSLTAVEKLNPMLLEFGSPLELVERLRRIESENLDIMQQSQNTVEEINAVENQIVRVREESSRKVAELRENSNRLLEVRKTIEKNIRERKDVIERTEKMKLQIDSSKPDASKQPLHANHDPREEAATIGEMIARIHKYAPDHLLKEFEGGGILQQLLCIERTVNFFADEKRRREADGGKRQLVEHSRGRKKAKEEKVGEEKGREEEREKSPQRVREERVRAWEEGKKREKEAKMQQRVQRLKNRKAVPRTYAQEEAVVEKTEEVDKERLDHEKYFG